MTVTTDTISPFCVGKEAVGEGFIGRKSQIEEYSRKLFDPRNSGNLSISGLPRIGKSSLARMILRGEASKGNERLLIAEVGNLGGCRSFSGLCKKIARCIKKELKKADVDDSPFKPLLDAVNDSNGDYDELSWAMEDLFEQLNDEGYKTVIFIDEFDYADRVFNYGEECDAVSYFQLLRALITEPTYNVSMLIVSRRSLSLLEERSCGASTFHGAFDNQQLAGFTDAELGLTRDLLSRYGVCVADEQWSSVLHLAGRVPYLLSMICNDLLILREERAIEEIIDGCEQRVYEYCKDVLGLLEDEDSLKHLIQVCIGPRYDIVPQQVAELENRGYLIRVGVGYAPVCGFFEQYLRDVVRTDANMDISPNLTSAEKKLRLIVEHILRSKMGDDWASVVRADYETRRVEDPAKYRYFVDFAKADKFMDSNKRKFGIVEENFLNVVSIAELSQIMKFYWADFARVFNGQAYSVWEPKFKLLQRTRDPLAHSNLEYLTSAEVEQANMYCNEIIGLKLE